MDISIHIPPAIEQALLNAEGCADPGRAMIEATAIELYRRGKLAHHELTRALGLSRFELDGLLKRHGVTEDLLTPQELASEIESIRRLLAST